MVISGCAWYSVMIHDISVAISGCAHAWFSAMVHGYCGYRWCVIKVGGIIKVYRGCAWSRVVVMVILYGYQRL